MRSSTLVLLFLISVQAALNMGEDAPTPPTHHPHHTHHHHHHHEQQHQQRKTAQQSHTHSHTMGGRHHSPNTQQPELIPTVDPKLFNKRRYRSSRVRFSAVVPPDSEAVGLATADREQGRGFGGQGLDRGPRVRRRADQVMHRGEYSVCDSVNHWVNNMTRATDIKGREVTVLPDVRIGDSVMKQLFYETTCRFASTPPRGRGAVGAGGKGSGGSKGGNNSRGGLKSGPSASGCRGIDSRHWTSYCTNTHTYVRALTTWQNQLGWRLIRINAACVCVISRKSWGDKKG